MYSRPEALSRIRARTPSSSWSRSISSWPKRIRPGESSSARAFSSGSRRICGRFSCRHGLAARQNSSSPPAPQDSKSRETTSVVGDRDRRSPRRTPSPPSARRACSRCAIASATPTSSSTSIARWLSTCALGRSDVVARALTSRCSTPWRASSIDAVSPAPPPPTIRTGTFSSAAAVNSIVFSSGSHH